MMFKTRNSTYEIDEENRRLRRTEDRAKVGCPQRDEWREFAFMRQLKVGRSALFLFEEAHTNRELGECSAMMTSVVTEIWE
jgi:hypothetical protein